MTPNSAIESWMNESFKGGALWLDGPEWSAIAAGSKYSDEAMQATRALQEVFPWSWIRRRQGDRIIHPMLQQHSLRCGVEALLELGVALSRLSSVPHRLKVRLRDPRAYSDCVAELAVGLLLSDLGATIIHEPVPAELRGPDWLAQWSDVRVAVEVKHPHLSEKGQTTLNLEMAFLGALQRCLQDVDLSAAAWLTFHMDRSLETRCAVHSWLKRPEIDAAAQSAATALKARLPVPIEDAQIALEGVGSFEIRLGPSGPPRFHLSGIGSVGDRDHETSRLERVLRDAALQLATTPGVLHVAALHVGSDATLANWTGEIEGMLCAEPWAASIDAVIIIDALARDLSSCNLLITRPDVSDPLRLFAAYLGL